MWNTFTNLESAIKIAALIVAILLRFLRLVIPDFVYHWPKRQTELRCQPFGKVRNQSAVILRRHTGNPFRVLVSCAIVRGSLLLSLQPVRR